MVPRRDGKRLEPRQKTAGSGAGATGMVAAPDRIGDRGPSGDGERIPARGGGRGAIRGRQPAGLAAKTGHQRGGVHRTGFKNSATRKFWCTPTRANSKPATSGGGVHRPGGHAAARPGAVGELLVRKPNTAT